MDYSQFVEVRRFLVEMLTQLRVVIESGAVRVGMATFADRQFHVFNLNTYLSNFNGVIDAVRTAGYVGGGTNTGLGTSTCSTNSLTINYNSVWITRRHPENVYPGQARKIMHSEESIAFLLGISRSRFYPHRLQSRGWGFHRRVSVCAFQHDVLKTDAARITKRGVQMFHDESWKPVYFGFKRSKVKVTSHKNNADVNLCTLVSASLRYNTIR